MVKDGEDYNGFISTNDERGITTENSPRAGNARQERSAGEPFLLGKEGGRAKRFFSLM